MPLMTPDDLHQFIEREFPRAPPGISVESVDDTTIRVRQKTEDRHLGPGGTISGPTLTAMVDCGFYLWLLARLGPVALAVTTNLNINFMRKPEPGNL
jgi:acyl-coenzyme A thioesterase PaaI-like protein